MGKLTKLIIDRRKWGRGNSGGSLLGENGLKCCLGFQCTALGFKNRDILKQGMPSDLISNYTSVSKGRTPKVKDRRAKKLDWLVKNLGSSIYQDSMITARLAAINDSIYTTDEYKEEQITALFKENGVKVIFKH